MKEIAESYKIVMHSSKTAVFFGLRNTKSVKFDRSIAMDNTIVHCNICSSFYGHPHGVQRN